MAEAAKFEILGEFVDHISPELKKLATENIPLLIGSLVGLAASWGIENISEMISKSLELGDEIGKLAQKTGIAAEQLSAFGLAAKLSDVSTQEFATSMRKLNDKIAEGNADVYSDAAIMFKKMGIEIKDADGKARDGGAVMGDLAEKFKNSKDGAEKVAGAFALMGKSGVQMIPMLNGGKEALDEAAKSAQDFGLIWNKDQTKAAEEFNDSMTMVKEALGGVGQIVAKDLAPKLAEIAKYFADAFKEGGLFRAMLDSLAAVINGGVGAALDILATVGAVIGAVFHQAGIAIGGTMAAAQALLNLDWEQAVNIVDMMKADLAKVDKDFADFQEKIWNPEKIKPKIEETKDDFGNLGTTANKLQEQFEKAEAALRKELNQLDAAGKTFEVIYQTQHGTYKKFNEQQKEKLIDLAREIDYHKLLADMLKQEQALSDQRNNKVTNAKIGLNKSYVDPKEAAGYQNAMAQKLAMDNFLNNQQELADKNKDEQARERLTKEIAEKRKLYDDNGELYKQADKMGQMEYEVIQQTKNYATALGTSKTQIYELTQAQAQYKKMLDEGTISQDRYNDLMKQSSRSIDEITNSLTEAGRAFQEVAKNRQSMEDVVIKMANLRDMFDAGKISAAEYKSGMFALQQSYDNLNPTFAINQVQKMRDEVTRATGAFEGMFADGIFNALQGKFTSLGDLVKTTMDRMVANILAAQIQFALFGDLGSTPSGKTASNTGLIGAAFSSLFGGFRADGGDVQAGKAYIVGEKRPELFVPQTSGSIIPKVASGGSGGNNVTISVSALDGADVMKVLGARKKEIAQMVTSTNRTYNLRGV